MLLNTLFVIYFLKNFFCIKGIHYDGTASDIWSCGIILYALLTGNLPFDDENIRRLLSKVKTGVYYMPEYLSSDAKNLISRMLVVDPAKRIKMPEIMKHPWFTSIPPKAQYLPAALESVGVKYIILLIIIVIIIIIIRRRRIKKFIIIYDIFIFIFIK